MNETVELSTVGSDAIANRDNKPSMLVEGFIDLLSGICPECNQQLATNRYHSSYCYRCGKDWS